MSNETPMTVEAANALRIANESELVGKIIPLLEGYAAEEIVGALLSVSVQMALQTHADNFSASFRIHDRLSVEAVFSVKPVNQQEAETLVQEAKEKGLI